MKIIIILSVVTAERANDYMKVGMNCRELIVLGVGWVWGNSPWQGWLTEWLSYLEFRKKILP
jgi:hypothetical protein